MTRKLVDKIAKKNFDKKCYFCDENNYHLLDVHRIVPGEEGGEYTDFNSLTVCANHHRLIHSGYLKIDRKYASTKGNILHYWMGDEEYWN